MIKIVMKSVLAIVVVFSLVGVVGYFQMQQYLDTPMQIDEKGVEYNLAKGSSLGGLVYALAREKVLLSPRWLMVYSRLTGRGVNTKAGEYFFEKGLTPRDLLTKIERGDIRYYQVTLVEGWTLKQAYAQLRRQSKLKKQLGSSWESELTSDLLAAEEKNKVLEGLFFPDTYQYHSGLSDKDILKQAYTRLQTVLDEEWKNRADGLPYKNPYEALIMASLIEKETGAPEERTQIAGVFVRRLQKRMRLQTDPAVIYGVKDYQGNLRSRHLKDKSNPYNTYRHHGLPPSPIALVGREAIYAALHPKDGNSLYFVAKGDGSHYFSSTLREHTNAVRKYQIYGRKKNYSSAPKQK